MSVDIALGSTLAGCRIERLLGRGGMGAVYLAQDERLQRRVAIKVLAQELADDEHFRRRFLLESQLAAGLDHPHIVPIFAAGEQDDVLFLAMKYVEGVDVRELIRARDHVGEARTVALMAQIADALDTAHGLGLVHRDVKPANILVGDGDHAYLCDFGLARHASSAGSMTGNAFVGTVAYSAPEQIEGGTIDARADVYSLGCVVYECLTGAAPFERAGDLQVLFAHLNEPPPIVTGLRPDLPDAVDPVMQKALAKAPDDRFSTCGEMVAALGDALAVAPPPVARAGRRSIPGVRTFLVAGLRGEADAAAAFADLVRGAVEARDGRLIELRGDEAVVVFDAAEAALRAAIDLRARDASVAIGLEAGEAVPVAGGYRGSALNLAARLCALAEPGEVLAGESVVALARDVQGVRYGERREERVKGLAEPLTAVTVLPAGQWWRPTGAMVAAELALVAVIVAAAIALLGGGSSSGGPPQVGAESVGFLSPTGEVEASVPAGGTGDLALLGRTLWLANFDDKTLERIDVRTHRLLHPFVSIQNGFGGTTAGFGAVWAVDGRDPVLHRVDPRYLTIDHIRLPIQKNQVDFTAPTEAEVGAGSVWVAMASKVFRVDPRSRRVVATIDVPEADLLAYGDGKLWVAQSNLSKLSEIDPASNQVVSSVTLRNFIDALAVGGGYVWATSTPGDGVWKIRPDGNIEKTIHLPGGEGPMTFYRGGVWVPSNTALQRIDPTTDAITSFPVRARPQAIVGGAGTLVVASGQYPPKLPPLPADQVAHVSLAEDWLDDIDPAHAFPGPAPRYQLEYATGAQLLNYPDASGARGARLVPEVAAAMPAVSRDGRTYSFRIRPGFRFSPPSNEVVTAESFKSSIERALSPRLGDNPGFTMISDVVGADAFHAGKAQHVSGIVADGDTLRIRLVAPAGDFAERLSMPYFAAVPIGTPIVKGGVQTPIPSAGPYYLRVKFGSELAVLERNPNYHGSRPHRLQRIVYDINDDAQRTIAKIDGGKADYAADVIQDAAFAAGGTLERRLRAARARGQRSPLLVRTPQLATIFLQFNTARGPFADARLRRAVNYAIDRRALAAVDGNVPTAAYLPPGMPSAAGTSVYSLAPDLARARALTGGRKVKAVLYTCNRPECSELPRIVRANLAPLGISVRIRQFDDPFSAAFRAGARYDILAAGWGWDYPDPYEVLNSFLDPAGFRPDFAPPPLPIPASARRRLERAALLRGPAREAAYRAEASRLAREVAPFAAYGTPVVPELFSARVGCRVTQPVVGLVDLGALCARSR
jgi:serine/threonine-protein kinase